MRDETWRTYAQDNDKYVLSVMQGTDGGSFWRPSAARNRELDSPGSQTGNYFPDRNTAAAGLFTVGVRHWVGASSSSS